MPRIDISNLRGDLFGGITAGIVALPLALALGVASGMGPIAGLYGAIFVGFFAALFGGTPAQISGPTGPMVVVLAGVAASLPGRPDLVFTAVMLAGLFQIGFGVLRLGEYIRLVPYPVVSGFMSGIGVIIVLLQVGRLLGSEPPGDTVSALVHIAHALSEVDRGASTVGVLTVAVAFCWPKGFAKYLPAPLAALIAGTIAGLFVNAPVLGDIPSGLPRLQMPVFDREAMLLVLEVAIVLAALGAIDSLLTSLVADNVTRTRHDSNRELIGQGIGNTVAGLFGGIAGAGATMRTIANIRTGGRTPLSGMLHAVVLLAFVLGLGPLAARIPHAALAGILVKVGWDIIDWNYLKRAHRGPRWDLLLMFVVLGLTVFADLITAVAIGVVLASIAYVRQVATAQIEAVAERPHVPRTEEEAELTRRAGGRIHVLDFAGPLSFGATADLVHHVRERSRRDGTKILILDLSRVPFVDVSAARAIEAIVTDARQSNRTAFLAGVKDEVLRVLTALGADHGIDERHVFPTRIEALREAVSMLETAHDSALPRRTAIAG